MPQKESFYTIKVIRVMVKLAWLLAKNDLKTLVSFYS